MIASLVEDFAGPAKTGPTMPERLASIMNKLFDEKLPEEKEKQLREEYMRPENTHGDSPNVNLEIWRSLNQERRGHDLKLRKIGNQIVNANSANMQLIRLLYEARRYKQIGRETTDQDGYGLRGNQLHGLAPNR